MDTLAPATASPAADITFPVIWRCCADASATPMPAASANAMTEIRFTRCLLVRAQTALHMLPPNPGDRKTGLNLRHIAPARAAGNLDRHHPTTSEAFMSVDRRSFLQSSAAATAAALAWPGAQPSSQSDLA